MKKIAVIGAFALAAGCAQTPPAPSPEAKSQLAPSGTLRVAVLTSNPIIGVKDASSGEVKGTTVDLGRALAAGAGVPARIIGKSTRLIRVVFFSEPSFVTGRMKCVTRRICTFGNDRFG